MNIYKSERAIANKIKDNKILCYSKAINTDKNFNDSLLSLAEKGISVNNNFAFADLNDSDLYFHQSILVSTNWNSNDDVFLPDQVWAARQSPNHKPTNFEHNSTKIVGHIVGNYAINTENELIPDDTLVDELPSKFHILTNAVIYRVWHSDATYQEQVEELITAIESGEMYVSMEAMFPDFSYALGSEDGNIKIISRNENTAFLSEHLRIYGGTGSYGDFKVGRVPKNIRFIGKGYTKNPANKESVTFSKDNIFSFNKISFAENFEKDKKNGVSLNSKQISNGDSFMSENNKQIEELIAKNTSLQTQLENIQAELAKADIQKYETKVSDLTENNKVLSAKLESATQDVEELKTALSEKEKSLEEAVAKTKELQESLDTIKAESIYAARVAKFESLGFDNEVAQKKAKTFANLTDEQFEEVVAEMKPYEKKDKEKAMKEKEDKAKAEEELSKNDELDKEGTANAEKVDVESLETDENIASAAEISDEETNDENTVSLAAAISSKLKVTENK